MRHMPTSSAFSLRDFLALSRGFWRGPTARMAWWLTAGLSFFTLANIGVQYALNLWNRYFFNALEHKDLPQAYHAITLFLGLAVVAILVIVAIVWFRMTIQAHWRRWMTTMLSSKWLKDRYFYQMNIAAPEVDNPEFRMTDDVKIAVEAFIDFAIGIANALLMTSVFLGVLYSVGGSLDIGGTTIPAYFIVAAATYGLANSGLMLLFGKPLIVATEEKNAAEARSRFELVRIKENAESIALIGGEDDERENLKETLTEVVQRWAQVIKKQSMLTTMTHGNAMLTPIIPLLLGTPKYLAGQLTLGEVMQLAAAFVQVQLSFNWLVDNYMRIAEWQASAGRIAGLWRTLNAFEAQESDENRLEVGSSPDGNIHLHDVSVALLSGRVLVDGADITISPQDKVLVKGESGSGKSTLIRALAGLWPWGDGRIEMPDGKKIIFQPQKPYIPLGTLREALLYPTSDMEVTPEELRRALIRAGLRPFLGRLDDSERWDQILSGGQQQRLGFARLLLQRPDIVIMDEATSALDEDSQFSLMTFFNDELKECTLISVGHRPGLEDFHDRVIELKLASGGAQVQEADMATKEKRELRFLTRLLRRMQRSNKA